MDNAQIQHIQGLNTKAIALNTERAKILGAVEASRRSLDSGLAQYNARYGTKITVESLQGEYDALEKQLIEQAESLEKQINYIESGEYKNKAVTVASTAPVVTGSNGVQVQNVMSAPQYAPQGVVPNVNLATPVQGFGTEALNNTQAPVNNVQTPVNNASAPVNNASAGFNVSQTVPNNASAGFNVSQTVPNNASAGFNISQTQPTVDTKTGAVSFGTSVNQPQQVVEPITPPSWGGTPAPTSESVNSHLNNLLSQGFN